MLYVSGIWLQEYHDRIGLAGSISELRQDIYNDAYQFQDKVRDYERQIHERAVIEQRLLELQQNQARRQDPNQTVTRPLWSLEPAPAAPTPPAPRVEDTNIPSKIQLLGVLELELSETTSWHTLIKMIATVLVTFFGLKSINFLFQRLESTGRS